MTRRITCYVVFVTLIWGAHTQNEENIRDNKFKSNMTRTDFSNLLSSLIKLNEKRVSVLQRLYKLEDYGVLSEVLRTGDRKPESGNGNPNNLFLIVMSKNETNPSRRNGGFEVVDTVTSLDVGNKKDHPKLNYVLDAASFISQNTNKKKSKESIFGNIPKVHRPKEKRLIKDESENDPTTKKLLKHHKPAQRTEEVRDDTNILRAKKTGPQAKKEKQSKLELLSKERNSTPSQELRDFDDNINSYPQIGYHDPPHYPEISVTKTVTMEDAIFNNNHKYRDRQDEHDYSYPFSKEYADYTAHRQENNTDVDISSKRSKANRNKAILNNQSNKYTVIKTAIKPSTTKNNLRMMSNENSDKIDTLSNNNQNHSNSEEKEDENDYGSPFSKEYVENGPSRKYTKIDSDISTKKVHDNNSPGPNKKSQSPEIKVKGDQHFTFNGSMSMLNNPDNKYTAIMGELKTTTANSANRQDTETGSDISTEDSKFYGTKPILNNNDYKDTTVQTTIKPTTIKNELRINSTVNTDKTDTLANNKQNDKLTLEDENYYGSPFSKEYDENYPNRQNTKIDDYNPKMNVQDKQPPNLNQSKSMLEQDITYSTTNTDITTTTAKNDVKIVSTVNIDKASEGNQSTNNPNLNLDLKDSEIKDDHPSKEIVHNNEFPPLPSQNTSGGEITETTKDLPLRDFNDYDYPKHVGNETNEHNPGIARDYPDEVDYGDEESENNTNHVIVNPSPPVMISENVDVKTTPPVTIDSPSHFENVTENSSNDKPKAAIILKIGNNSKEKSNNGGDFIIDKKKGDEFSIIVTHLGKEKPEEIKQPDVLKVNQKEVDQPEGKPIARKAFQKCLNKKAKKMCCKSCIRAYKNVCTRLKCTSKAKKALKKECKKSCEKTFKSSSSKYSDEDSDDSDSDYSDSDSS